MKLDLRPLMTVAGLAASFSAECRASFDFDVISQATCVNRLGRLGLCGVSQELPAGAMPLSTRVPLKSVFHFEKSGDCRTPFPMVLTASSTSVPAESIPILFLSAEASEVRLRGRGSLAGFRIELDRTWIKVASFDSSCRIRARVEADLADVSSQGEASIWVSSLESDLAATARASDHVRELILYQAAFHVLFEMTEAFQAQLADRFIDAVSGDLDQAIDGLEKIADSTTALSAAERSLLEKLIEFLPTLKAPDGFKGKSLIEFFPEQDRSAIAALVEKLRSQAGTEDLAAKRAELTELEGKMVGYCREASVMEIQLAQLPEAVSGLDSLKSRFECER